MQLSEGIVLRAVSGVYTVQSGDTVLHCTLRGNLKKEFTYSTSDSRAKRVIRAKHPYMRDTVSVGDRVRFAESHQGAGIIEEVLPRTTRFTRQGFRGREQTMVCNLDQLVICFACAEPNPDPWKIDRFLVAAEVAELDPLIVGNKSDLIQGETAHLFTEWAALGYRVITTSVREGEGMEELRDALKHRISAFVGPSGVGKSSLLNTIQPGLNIRVGDIGYVTYKGRHTTTASQLHPLHFGGWVADTPGLRQLELLEVSRDELLACFPEFDPYLGHCRFQNCRHDSEPDCALKNAVESGAISARRYESFIIIGNEMEKK